MTGTVISYSTKAGFGFINVMPQDVDVYFHVTTCRDAIAPPVGSKVTFLLVNGNRGPQAAHVELVTLSADALKSLPKEATCIAAS